MSELDQQAEATDGLVARAKAMIFSPTLEWPKVAAEADSVQDVVLRYVAPLAAITPLAGLIRGQMFGIGVLGVDFRPPLMGALTTAITSYVLALASIFAVSWIAAYLAARFGGQASFARAFKLCAYSFTAAWVVGVFGLIPSLGVLSLLGLYSLYVFYLGATAMVGVPQDRAGGYTAVTFIAAVLLYLVAGAITAVAFGPLVSITSASTEAGDDAQVEVNVPGYGDVRISNDGQTQTVEAPGLGTVEVTQDGESVTINGEEFSAEITDAPAAPAALAAPAAPAEE